MAHADTKRPAWVSKLLLTSVFILGYEVAKDFNPFMQDLTQKLQKVIQLDSV